jgi:LysM repeat protein
MAIKHQDEDIENLLAAGSSWTTTLSDLMSSLMILFLALFAFYLTSHAPIKSKSDEKTVSKEQPKIVEENKGGPLEKPYIEVTLKNPVLLRYEKMNTKQGMKETLDELKNEVANATEIKFEGDITKPQRGGLYPANWVRKIAIKVTSDPENQKEYYVVKQGDNLWTIAKKYMMDAILTQELARINNIKDAANITPGQLLEIPKKAQIDQMRKIYRRDPPIVRIFSGIYNRIFKK